MTYLHSQFTQICHSERSEETMDFPTFPNEPAGYAGISFHSEDIDFSLEKEDQIITWIEEIVRQEGKELRALSYVFCSDNYLHQINIEYLEHDTLTDIITFPLAELPVVESDIFISIDRVKENAAQFEVSFERELKRVLIHGVLHLCGYGDKTEMEVKIMRQKETDAIELFEKMPF